MINFRARLRNARLPAIVRQFINDEAIGGRLLLVAAAAALIVTNLFWQSGYEQLWQTHFSIGLGSWALSLDLRQWLNDGLMSIFFLLAGLEIKREIVDGELRSVRAAILPIAAAIGGMIIPALLYLALNIDQPGAGGWGIPMATDIAIAMGLLLLLGRRVPAALKIFLLTLAIVDDIDAIIVIAVFYNQSINPWSLIVAAAIIGLMIALNRSRYMNLPIFVLLGIALWLAVQTSGISASIAGVILGLLAPLIATKEHRRPIATHLEKALLPATTFIIVPLFVFANAGVAFSARALDEPGALLAALGIMLGLVAGKVIGITGASWLVIKLRLGRLPSGTNWPQFIGLGFLAGVGFTISIFITNLAFSGQVGLIDAAKIGIFAGSAISAGLGLFILKITSSARTERS